MSGRIPMPSDTTPVPLIRLTDLEIRFSESEKLAPATQAVSFSVNAGETLGIVGESGCGKSITLRALLGLVPRPGVVTKGQLSWSGGPDLLADAVKLRRLRGRSVSMIFQDPLTSLNPVFSVGNQLMEALKVGTEQSRAARRATAVALLDRVGIPSAARRMRDYPHELSGGMRQRVMIAIALACRPQLLLADEPTTALDVTIQDQILSLLMQLQRETGMAIILVSHDLGVIAQTADRVAVMYAGRIVEMGAVDDVLLSPRHPYTAGLIDSVPQVFESGQAKLRVIGGNPPSLDEMPPGCPFAPRCRFAQPACSAVPMIRDADESGHGSACPIVDLHSRTGRLRAR